LVAMYSAIFSVLLNLGIIAKLVSKSMIYREMIDNYIKECYKETAYFLIEAKDEKANSTIYKKANSLGNKISNE
jgi:hypothetical protein